MNFKKGEVLFFNKPFGWTSFKVVGHARYHICRRIGVKKLKVGHAGTLDPLATGVMIVCTGKATKRIEEFQYHTKEYVATLRLGATTPSYDLEHEINATYPTEHITRELVEEVLEVNGIFRESICKIASIDLKKDETGILELAESYQVPFLTYPAEELKKAVCEDGFAESAFVESVTGVGNICERSALLAAGVQKLLIPKTARNGVTVAAAVMDLTICMED